MPFSPRLVPALLFCSAVAACAGAAATAAPSKKPKPKAPEAETASFVVPSFAVGCYTSDRRLVCGGYKRRPTLSMRRTGTVGKGSVRGSQPPAVAPEILAVGEEWSDGAFKCVHRPTGLTCRNLSRHGWWIGKNERYRRF
jgi:hypothetical protein